MICMISFLLSILVIMMDSPQWMISILITQTVMITMIVSLYKSSVWFSYILFLVFLGGLMVLFSYVVSLTASFKFTKFFGSSMDLFMASVSSMFMGGFLLFFNSSLIFTSESIYKAESNVYLNSNLWSSSSIYSYLFITLYLLLALFSIACLLKYSKGAMRSMS